MCAALESFVRDEENKEQSDLPVQWVGFISELCELIVTGFLKACWECRYGKLPPKSIEDWCVNYLGWQKESLVNTLGPIALNSLKMTNDLSKLDIGTSLDIILYVVPKVPYRLKCIIQNLFQMIRIGYHNDFTFSEEPLCILLHNIRENVKVLLKLQNNVFREYFNNELKVILADLKSSKRKLRKLKRKLIEHNEVVSQTRSDLEYSRKVFKSVIKFEDYEINTESLHSRSESLSRSSQQSIDSPTLVKEFENVFDSEVPSSFISVGADNDKQKLVEEQESLSGQNLPSELNDQATQRADEEFHFENEYRQRINSNASAEAVYLSLLKDISMLKSYIVNLQQSKKQISLKCDLFFTTLKEYEAGVYNHVNFRELNNKFPDECFQRGEKLMKMAKESSINQLSSKIRLQSLKNAESKQVIDLKEWFCSKKIQMKHPNDISLIIINLADKRKSVDINYILDPQTKEPVTIISGDSGSGKSHLCKYIIHQWRNASLLYPNLLLFDIALHITSREIRNFGSCISFMEKYVFQDLNYESIDALLIDMQNITSLIMIDTECLTEKDITAINNCVSEMPFAKIIIAVRPEFDPSLSCALHSNSIRFQRLKIQPITKNTLTKESRYILGIKEIDANIINDIIEFPMINPEVVNPLFLSFIYFLFKINKDVQVCLTKAKLLAQLLSYVREKIKSEMIPLNKTNSGENNDIEMKEINNSISRNRRLTMTHIDEIADLVLEELWEVSWDSYFDKNFEKRSENMLEIQLNIDYNNEWLYPLILPSGENKYVIFSSICEALAGFYYAQNVQPDSPKFLSLCMGNKDILNLNLKEQALMKETLIISAGMLILSRKFKKRLLTKLVSDFHNCMLGEYNFLLWLRLVKETDFSHKVCHIIKKELQHCNIWTTCNGTGCSDWALATLLRYEALKPRSVIISEKCPSSSELVCGLALCPKVDVTLRQMHQFCNWENEDMSDELVESLQPTGNLVEFWGYLGPEGCSALRHMQRLKKLFVRITSLEALLNLSFSLKYIRSVDELSLNLDLPVNTSPSFLTRLELKWNIFNLSLHKIRDSTFNWAKGIIKNLSEQYTSLYLEETKLSIDNIQDIRRSGFASNVYII